MKDKSMILIKTSHHMHLVVRDVLLSIQGKQKAQQFYALIKKKNPHLNLILKTQLNQHSL